MIVYVLLQHTGEYEDAETTVFGVFSDLEKAKATAAEKLPPIRGKIRWQLDQHSGVWWSNGLLRTDPYDPIDLSIETHTVIGT